MPRLHFAYHLPGISAKEVYEADFIASILNGGKSSRFIQNLVHQKQIVQDIQTFVLPMIDTSLFFVVATPRPEHSVEKIQHEIDTEIERLFQEAVSEQEMQRVKNQIIAQKVRDLQSVSTRADLLNMYFTYYGNTNHLNEEIDHYLKISAQDLRQTANNFLQPENRVEVIYLPKKN